ncbi:hypothetical protein RvY_02554-1 [Ramazzottius varieornatus]|uniref:ACB domain-containing protein n=1 Tax=Ramazzottius varieornatus TaxID=947166 RepID=A0A1D1UQX6_RAMVA|nr:hypothetical protein RvY_02554-1 [Ramazzottius varieornatus]
MWQRASLLAWRGIVQGQAAPRNVGSAAQRFPQAAALFQQQRLFASRAESFEDAKEKLNTLKEDPGPTVKLKLYGLFKQATTGECNVAKPGMLDMVGKAKWSAWKELGSMSQDDAKQKYIDTVNELLKEQGGDSEDSGSSGSSSTADSGKYETILYREEGKITYITLNRPKKMNSITPEMYQELTDALSNAANNKSYATVITGAGKQFSAGNDLGSVAKYLGMGRPMKEIAEESAVLLEKFVTAFIDHPKLLVGVVQGPCIGIACTTMGLYDVVYASDAAYFHTPFTSLGLTPEGCSSYTFKKIMGPIKANEMLLLGKKLQAAEALQAGFVTEVFPSESFDTEVKRKLEQIPKLLPNSLLESKKFMRSLNQGKLHKVNQLECDKLIGMWQGDECLNAAAKFMSRK